MVLQARHGNQEAFARLVQAYQTPVYNLAYRMLGNPTDAEDAIQETFVRAYTVSIRLRLDGSSLLDTCHSAHYCVDRLRRRHWRPGIHGETEALQWMPMANPSRRGAYRARAQQGDPPRAGCVARTVQNRDHLALLEDLSYDEIAEITGSTESAVQVALTSGAQIWPCSWKRGFAPETWEGDGGVGGRTGA